MIDQSTFSNQYGLELVVFIHTHTRGWFILTAEWFILTAEEL